MCVDKTLLLRISRVKSLHLESGTYVRVLVWIGSGCELQTFPCNFLFRKRGKFNIRHFALNVTCLWVCFFLCYCLLHVFGGVLFNCVVFNLDVLFFNAFASMLEKFQTHTFVNICGGFIQFPQQLVSNK